MDKPPSKDAEGAGKETVEKPDDNVSMLVHALVFSFALAVASIALTIFMYTFEADAKKINLTSATGAFGVVSLMIAWSPIIFLIVAFVILSLVVNYFISSLVFSQERAMEVLNPIEVGVYLEAERREKIDQIFAQRASGIRVAYIVVVLALMILSGLAIGYVFVTQTSNYVLSLIHFGILFLIMFGSTISLLFTIASNRNIVLFQYEKGKRVRRKRHVSIKSLAPEDLKELNDILRQMRERERKAAEGAPGTGKKD